MFFFKKGTTRANHYHKNLKELFVILAGIINTHFFDIKTPDQIEIKTAKKCDVFLFEKEIFHHDKLCQIDSDGLDSTNEETQMSPRHQV